MNDYSYIVTQNLLPSRIDKILTELLEICGFEKFQRYNEGAKYCS